MGIDASIYSQLGRDVPQIDPAGSYMKGIQLRQLVQQRQDDQTMRDLAKKTGGNLGQLADLAQGQGLYQQAGSIRKQELDRQKEIATIQETMGKIDAQRRSAIQAGNEDLGKMAAWADTPEKWQQGIQVVLRDHPIMAQGLQPYLQFSPETRKAAITKAQTVQEAMEGLNGKTISNGEGIYNVKPSALPGGAPQVTQIAEKEQWGQAQPAKGADGKTTFIQTNHKTGETRQVQGGFQPIPPAATHVSVGGVGGGASSKWNLDDPLAGLSVSDQQLVKQRVAGSHNQFITTRGMPNGNDLEARADALYGKDNAGAHIPAGMFSGAKKGQESWAGGGANGQTVVALNTLAEHLNDFQKIAQALNTGNVVMANQLGQAYDMAFGSNKKTNYDIMLGVLAGETDKVMSGNHPTESGQKEWLQRMRSSGSPDQLNGGISVLRHAVGGKFSGLSTQYKTDWAGADLANSGRLSPAAVSAFSNLNRGSDQQPTRFNWSAKAPGNSTPDMKTLGTNPRFTSAVWAGAGAPDGAGWYVKEGRNIRRVE